jgi:hypothetical protein
MIIKGIISVGMPSTPIHSVHIIKFINGQQGGYSLFYKKVTSVIHYLSENHYYTKDIVIEKAYSFDKNLSRYQYYSWRKEDHQNTKNGKCGCGSITCQELGLWEGNQQEIVSDDGFRTALQLRLEQLDKYYSSQRLAKEKRDAKKLADPVGHAEKLRVAKEKRDAKKAALATPTRNPVPGQWKNGVPPRVYDGSRASLGLKGEDDNAVLHEPRFKAV